MRIREAEFLLGADESVGAYYLAGYAAECGLKACIMAHVEATGAIFQDKKFSEKCWTHDLEELLKLANLKTTLDADTATLRFKVRRHAGNTEGRQGTSWMAFDFFNPDTGKWDLVDYDITDPQPFFAVNP